MRPLGARLPATFILLAKFFVATLLRSSVPLPLLRLGLRCGERDAGSLDRLVEEGILLNRLFGDVFRSLRAEFEVCALRSGTLLKVGKTGAVVALACPNMFDPCVCWTCFATGAVF